MATGAHAERYFARRVRLLEERRALQQEWDFLGRRATAEALVDDIGPGWAPLVHGLHLELLELDPDYRLEQVAEERGGLVFVARFAPAVEGLARRLIHTACAEALTTCEVCGEAGALRDRARAKTLCEGCFHCDRARAKELGERYADAFLAGVLAGDPDHPSAAEIVAWLDWLDAG